MSMDKQSSISMSLPEPNSEPPWHEANDLAAQDDLLDAIPPYLEITGLWPDQPMVWLNLGIALGGLHCVREARPCLQRALELGFDNPHVHYQVVQMQEYLGQPNAIAQSILTATELDPGFLDPWYCLANIHLQCGEINLPNNI